MKVFLALACVALLGVIAAQDWLVKALRNETISRGLSGPYHWWLDASYVLLAVALVGAMRHSIGHELIAVPLALALCLTAATNTFAVWWDANVGPHSVWHTDFTIAVFVAAFALEVAAGGGWLRWVTAVNIVLPVVVYLRYRFLPDGVAASPAAEKAAVLMLAIWFIAWAL